MMPKDIAFGFKLKDNDPRIKQLEDEAQRLGLSMNQLLPQLIFERHIGESGEVNQKSSVLNSQEASAQSPASSETSLPPISKCRYGAYIAEEKKVYCDKNHKLMYPEACTVCSDRSIDESDDQVLEKAVAKIEPQKPTAQEEAHKLSQPYHSDGNYTVGWGRYRENPQSYKNTHLPCPKKYDSANKIQHNVTPEECKDCADFLKCPSIDDFMKAHPKGV